MPLPNDWVDQVLGGESDSGTTSWNRSWVDKIVPPAPSTEGPVDLSPLRHKIKRESFREKEIGKDTVQGQAMREFLAPSVDEFDRLKTNPILTEEFKQGFANTLQGYAQLATQPIEIVRGGAEFALALPGFALGILAAGQKIAERMGAPFTINDLYDAASEGMAETQEFWSERMVEPLLGEPTRESQLVGQTAMAPALGLSLMGQHAASFFEDYPNVQGVAKFAGDVGGLVALGRIYKGPKQEVAAKAESITRKADGIATREEIINKTVDEKIKVAQQKILEMEKVQLEREAQEIMDNLDYGKMIEQDLSSKSKRIKQIKQPKKRVVDEQVDKAMKRIEGEETVAKATGEEMLGEPLYEVVKSPDKEAVGSTITKKGSKGKKIKFVEADGETLYHSTSAQEFTDFSGDVVYLAKDPKETSIFATNEVLRKEGGTPRTIEVLGPKGKSKDINQLVQNTIMESGDLNTLISDQAKIARREGYEYLTFEHPGIGDSYFETKVAVNPKKLKIVREDKITEIDLQTGTREPVELGTEQSPFRQTPEETANYTKSFERMGDKAGRDMEIFVAKELNEINKFLDGKDADINRAREVLSQLAVDIADPGNRIVLLDYFNGDSGRVDGFIEMVSEAASWARKAERKGTKLTSGIDPVEAFKMAKDAVEKAYRYLRVPPVPEGTPGYDAWVKTRDQIVKLRMEKEKKAGQKLYDITGAVGEGAKEIIAGARKVADYTRRARGMKSFKPGVAAKMLRENFNRAFIDRSGNIRKEMLKKINEDGYEVLQKMYLSKGASSRSAMMLDQMRKEVYRGLSKNEKRVLDNLILADRMIDIGSYKTKFKFPKDIEPKNSIAYKELFEQIEGLSPDRVASLRRRAEAYFEWMKKPLKDMLESGLISEGEYEALASHNYRRIKLVDIYDKRYQAKIGKTKRTVYDSGVEALARGRETDVFEPSSEIMALEVFNRAYGRIMNNEANRTLLEVARKHPENPFVRVRTKDGDKIPTGWNRVFTYEGGERKSLYISPEMSKEWIVNNPDISYKFGNFLRYVSGAPILRTFATGINWGFAVANLPRDVMHTWFVARTFKDGKWTSIYNPVAPIFGLQIGRDLGAVFGDAVGRKGRYIDYINEGGGMEFLVHQGRLFQRGRHIEKPLDKVFNFLGYFGETSEIMTRLAIRERVMRKGKSSQEATFAARDYMDFGQGGGFAKALDNGLPYLNAAIQGTRGMFRAFKDNPWSSSFKLMQFASVVTGLTVAMRKMHPESVKELEGNIDAQNNLIIPLGDEFGFEDEQGQIRYPYIKIPLDPGQKFFKTFFEAATNKWLGYDIDVDSVVDSLKEQSPVGVGELPPSISGALGYITNKDFWLNEDIWTQTDKPFSFPSSREEFTERTPEAYKDLGAATGLSPERTRYAVEELVTSGTLWSHLLGEGYDKLFADLPKEKKQQHLAMTLARTPVFKRFIGVTNPYSKHAQKINQAQEEAVLEQFVQNRDFDIKVEGYLYDKNVTRKELVAEAKKWKDRDVYDRLMKRLEFEEDIQKLPEKSFWRRMKGLRLEAKAKVFVDRLESSNEEEKAQLWREYSMIERAGGVVSPELEKEIRRQMSR